MPKKEKNYASEEFKEKVVKIFYSTIFLIGFNLVSYGFLNGLIPLKYLIGLLISFNFGALMTYFLDKKEKISKALFIFQYCYYFVFILFVIFLYLRA